MTTSTHKRHRDAAILSAAGLTTKSRLREIAADDYDLEALSSLIDEGAA